MQVSITAVSYCVPEERLTHKELQERFGPELMDRVAETTGIYERRVVRDGECASDLAENAAEALFREFDIDRDSIDLLIFATQTPDFLLPTTACLLQSRLGLSNEVAAFDVNLGCSQYIYSISIASSMISAGLRKRALVLTGDTVSRILNPNDKAVVPLFGDAGTATLVEMTEEDGGFLAFDFGTDGNGGDALIWPSSGMRNQSLRQSSAEKNMSDTAIFPDNKMRMNGTAVYVFTLKTIPKTVQRCIDKAMLKIEDIDLFVIHQASELIIKSAAKQLKVELDRFHMHFGHLGNSGGSTVAICLADAVKKKCIKPGMNLVLSSFGAGFSWGSALIKWPKSFYGSISIGE